MAEKEPKQAPLAPKANGNSRSDTVAASDHAKELKRKKHIKWFIYFVAFVVFQTGIIALFALTIMKFRTPKFRVRSATLEPFDVGSVTNSSFNIKMNAEFGVKNTNFGHYRYQNTTVEFYYRDTKVGNAFIRKARAKARETRKFNVTVDLSYTGTSELGNDISTGVLPLSSTSRMRGKITIMKLMKKNRSTNMNCTMDVVVATKMVQNLICK